MKKIVLLSVGKTSKPYYRAGVDEYLKRLASVYEITEIELDEKPTLEKEGEQILKHCNGKKVLMDVGAKQYTSEEFASFVARTFETSDRVTFIIGGARGVCQSVRDAADVRIGLSAMTFPHQMAKLVLCEQLYRAHTVIVGKPYHK